MPKANQAATRDIEASYWQQGYTHVAGVDEAGRGCLAGPVVAAAVILPQDMTIPGIADSKKLSPAKREDAAEHIQQHALSIGIGLCTPGEIDELNILWAAMEAMRRAVTRLDPGPDFVLIDGNRCFPNSPWPYETLVKGDARCHAVAAASILAKTIRDQMMADLHTSMPCYNWVKNKGYPTKDHYDALTTHGPSRFHRRSFRLTR